MAKKDGTHKTRFGMEMPVDLYERLSALARENNRSLKAELIHAAERHLDAPPKVTTVEQTPPLPGAELTIAAAKVRGRPRLQRGGVT